MDEFCILESSLTFKNNQGKHIATVSAGWLPFGDFTDFKNKVDHSWATSVTLLDHYVVGYGNTGSQPIAHIGYIEDDNFGYFTTAKFNPDHSLASTWTHIGFGDTKNDDGSGFFTNAVIVAADGPIQEQSIGPFMWRYHSSWTSKGNYSAAVFTAHNQGDNNDEHSFQVMVGKRDLGPIPVSAGIGAKVNTTMDGGSVNAKSVDAAVSLYSKSLTLGKANITFEANYISDFSGPTNGAFTGYVNLTYDLSR